MSWQVVTCGAQLAGAFLAIAFSTSRAGAFFLVSVWPFEQLLDAATRSGKRAPRGPRWEKPPVPAPEPVRRIVLPPSRSGLGGGGGRLEDRPHRMV